MLIIIINCNCFNEGRKRSSKLGRRVPCHPPIGETQNDVRKPGEVQAKEEGVLAARVRIQTEGKRA
jgi:hypothetical protein